MTATSEVGVGGTAQEDSGFRDQASMTKVLWKEEESHFVCSWCVLPALMPTRKIPNLDGTWELARESTEGTSPWMRCFTIGDGVARMPDGTMLKLRYTQDKKVKLEGKEIYLKNGELCRAGSNGEVRRWRACGLPGSPNGPNERMSKIRGGVLNGAWELLPQFISASGGDVPQHRIVIRKDKVTYGDQKLSLEKDGKGRAWLEGRELLLVSGYLLLAADRGNEVTGWRRVYGDLEDEQSSDTDSSADGSPSASSSPQGRCHAATQTHAKFECECRCGLPLGIAKMKPKRRRTRKSKVGLLGRGTPVQ